MPISHLSFLSEVLEKVVAGQLNEHLAINNIHDKFQSAYRPGFRQKLLSSELLMIYYMLWIINILLL